MIVATIEIRAGGYRERRKELAQLALWNVSDLAATSDYCFALFDTENRFRDEVSKAGPAEAFYELDTVAERLEVSPQSTIAWGSVFGHRRVHGCAVLLRDALASAVAFRASISEPPAEADKDA